MKSKKPYILIVDDDPEDQSMLTDQFHLRNPSVDIKCLGSGVEALEFLRRCPAESLPALILLDYSMPTLTAPEVLDVVRDQPGITDIPKAVWSSSINPDHATKCFFSGATCYYYKPSTLSSLDALVQALSHLLPRSLS